MTTELTHAQEKFVQDIQRASADLQIAVRRALCNAGWTESKSHCDQIEGLSNSAIRTMLNPPEKKVKP